MCELSAQKWTASKASFEGVIFLLDLSYNLMQEWAGEMGQWGTNLFLTLLLFGSECFPSRLSLMLIYRERYLCPLLSELMVLDSIAIAPVPWKVPWFIPFILEHHICSLARKVTGREIFLQASIADHLAFFSYLPCTTGALRMGEAGTNNKGKFIPEQKAQCKDPTECINMQSRLIS